MFGPTEREKYLSTEVEAVHQVLGRLVTAQENGEINGFGSVAEGLRDVEMMLDVQGWTNVFEYDDDAGLTLSQIKGASQMIRELMVGNPFVKNGLRIRHANTWGGGIEFGCRNRTGKTKEIKELPVAVQAKIEDVRSQRYVFGNDAHEELEGAAFSDGNVYLLGEDSTKKLQRIQLHEITADLRNPNNTEEIWAFRREWYQNPSANSIEERKKMVRWYFTDIYDGTRQKTITHRSQREKVETGYTILDKTFNRQVGWAFGVPDALAIVAWARLYKEFLVNGYIMSRSLAKLAFKVTANTATGAANAGATVVQPGQAGSTVVEGAGNNLQPLLTAGRGYDFASGSPLAAAMAAGLGVSLLALTANPAAATGSNAAAQTLDPIAKATATVRRGSWDDYFLRIFKYIGLTQRLVVTWSDLKEEPANRLLQAWTLLHNSGLFDGGVVQQGMAEAMQIAFPGVVPEGYMLMNNSKSLKKSTDATAVDDPTNGDTDAPTDGTGQGDDDGTGKSDVDHDNDQE